MTDSFDTAQAAAALGESVRNVLADMAFLDAWPRTPSGASDSPESRAAIDVLKPASFRLELRMPPDFAAKVAAIILCDEPAGADASDGTFRGDDTVLEILNVIAGSFVTRYFGPGAVPRLELPHFKYYADGSEGEEICSLDFDVEGLPLRVVLSSIRYRY
ncbi:MAG TPA: hypothetical protein VLH39_02810 [Magnetospirillaceae bacterium]|nr:hypothetical protein [Magnetospirillaceae bacterium]